MDDGERRPGLRDDLMKPLGSNGLAPAANGGAGAFVASAALVAAAVILGETAFLRPLASPTAGRVAVFSAETTVPPPLRLTPSLDAPPPPAELVGHFPPPSSDKPPHVRAGASEPLIIDVQQALAALRATDLTAALR
jgi:hypothetical protein